MTSRQCPPRRVNTSGLPKKTGPRHLASLGALRVRARVGDGPRGLLGGRQCLGVTFPTPTPARRRIDGARTASPAICDRYQILCFALAFWNERDPILKERLFGVVPGEGNHGEDVKEYYFYLDNLPSHSYMKWLYKYPQREYPYEHLVRENQARRGEGPEYELLDTGIFDDDRYFDIEVEYAKDERGGHRDPRARAQSRARGGAPARPPASVVPQHLELGRRRPTRSRGSSPGPRARASSASPPTIADVLPPRQLPFSYKLGPRHLFGPNRRRGALFTDNETNADAVYGPGAASRSPYTKDAFHRHVVHGEDSTQPRRTSAPRPRLHYRVLVSRAGEASTCCFRFANRVPSRSARRRSRDHRQAPGRGRRVLRDHPSDAGHRRREAGPAPGLRGHAVDQADLPLRRERLARGRQRRLAAARIAQARSAISTGGTSTPCASCRCRTSGNTRGSRPGTSPSTACPSPLIDPEFAKEQLWLLLFEQFQHPSGQIPAYEWEFSDLNPPGAGLGGVAGLQHGPPAQRQGATALFLEKCFHKLLINFAWWVNKVDREGNNVFEGGFLGLDNITVIDRSEKLPHGAVLEQSDATGWMGMFCLQLMRISLELARENKAYEALATKFFQHYIYVGAAMKHMGGRNYQLFDEADGFFYDVLRFPDGSFEKFRVRSLVGLVPLYAIERLEEKWMAPFKEFSEGMIWFVRNNADVVQNVCYPVNREGATTHVLAIVDPDQTRRLLDRVFDPNEFWSRVRPAQHVEGPRPRALPLRGAHRELRARRGRGQDQGRQLQLARPDLVPHHLPHDRGPAQARHRVRT